MNLVQTALLMVLLGGYANGDKIRLEAKKLIRGKVLANGFSVAAKSLSHCIEYCNRRKKTCDGVVYHENIEKCRLISKCAAANQVNNSSSVIYYSRRPQTVTHILFTDEESSLTLWMRVKSKNYPKFIVTVNRAVKENLWLINVLTPVIIPGYVYDPKSDSCFGVVHWDVNFAEADEICKKQNFQLAVIDRRKVNQLVSGLLLRSGIKWAWINDANVAHEATVKPHGLSGNDVLAQEVFSPEVVEWRNASLKSCWAINAQGQWGQFSCKNDTMVPLCQVNQFQTQND